MLIGEGDHGLRRDHRHGGGRAGADGVVHALQEGDTLVAQITGNEVGHDLALAIRQHLVATGPACEDQVDTIRGSALSNKVGMGGEMLWRVRKPLQRRSISLRQINVVAELADPRCIKKGLGSGPSSVRFEPAWPFSLLVRDKTIIA